MIFGVVLVTVGGGKFFLGLANALFGTYRGGPAKVAIVGSSLFGMISGSSISNVLAVGNITIPMMKRTGFPAHFAGAIEACASTGGVIMPPVMGFVAFIMASWLNIPYFKVALAAAIPGCLYYFSLFLQVDAYAARNNLRGLQASEIPSLKQVLKKGWPYLIGIGTLVYFIIVRREAQAPFIASGVLLLVAIIKKEDRISFGRFFKVFEETGQVLSMVMGIMAGVGFIIGAFDLTGVGPAFASEMIAIAGGNLYLLLFLGALANLILGTGLTISACYIFLAIVLAPAFVRMGINPVAAHLFIIYWGVASYLTPPVAWPAYIAAAIAKAGPNKTAFQAMRLGIVTFMIPFFFVLCPALILQGPLKETVEPLIFVILGIFLMSGGLEGYVLVYGKLRMLERVGLFVSGCVMAIPTRNAHVLGIVLTTAIMVLASFLKRNRPRGDVGGCIAGKVLI
jgi:TRAP transporter 4TM/12TM fusion protein